MKLTIALICVLVMALAASAQQDHDMTNCSMHKHPVAATGAGSPHSEAVDQRGDQAMGFDHEKTRHHFLLKADGGIIRVEADAATDDTSRSAIRSHLSHIATAFSAGDFDIPMFVHDQVPPGVSVMQSKKDQIRYDFRELPAGAEVVIGSSDQEAIAAIHEFLKFQIKEHRTGDSLTVP